MCVRGARKTNGGRLLYQQMTSSSSILLWKDSLGNQLCTLMTKQPEKCDSERAEEVTQGEGQGWEGVGGYIGKQCAVTSSECTRVLVAI
jgi:hypothetical protein